MKPAQCTQTRSTERCNDADIVCKVHHAAHAALLASEPWGEAPANPSPPYGFWILFSMFCRVECAGFSIRLIPYSSEPVCALATSPINAKVLRFLTKGRW